MSKSRAYSTRLQFGDEIDEKAMEILEELKEREDIVETSDGVKDASTWIRDAIRRKIIQGEQESDVEKPEETNEEMTEETSIGSDFAKLLQDGDPISQQILKLLQEMDSEAKVSWVLEAAKMRYTLETHAPAFFINRYYEHQLNQYESMHREISPIAAVSSIDYEPELKEEPKPESMYEETPTQLLPEYLVKCIKARDRFQNIEHILVE